MKHCRREQPRRTGRVSLGHQAEGGLKRVYVRRPFGGSPVSLGHQAEGGLKLLAWDQGIDGPTRVSLGHQAEGGLKQPATEVDHVRPKRFPRPSGGGRIETGVSVDGQG